MKIGIIVYSQTGNTLQVAQKLQAALSAAGHEAALETVTVASGDPRDMTAPVLTNAPDPGRFDILYFGSPVQAFSLARAMALYLSQLPSLGGKHAACFLTQQLPYAWLGGNRGLRQMAAAVTQKGGEALPVGIVQWSNKQRAARIDALVNELAAAAPVNL